MAREPPTGGHVQKLVRIMIRRFRYALSIVRDLSMILCPASASVRAEVVAARDADVLAEREAETEVWEGYKFGPVSDSRQPVVDQPDHVAELVRFHHVVANQPDGVYCACHHRSHNDRRHAHHVAQLVEDMLTADARLANKFQS